MGSACQRAFASLYRELGKIGISAREAKACKVWEVASHLGVGWETQDPKAAGAPSADSRALLRQRVAAAAGEAPPPTAQAPTPEEIAQMQAAFSGNL